MARLISDRVRPLLGVSVVGHGLLSEPEHGHPVGTPYVVIRADCTDEAYYAEEELAEVARIRGDWHAGWRGRRVSGDYVLERRVFPTFSLLAGRDRARA